SGGGGSGVERVRGRREGEESLGRHHQRRQVVQAAELGLRQGRGVEMTWRATLLPLVGFALGCQSGSSRTVVQTQPTITTKSGVEMVLIPAGSFDMGSRHGREDEGPVHKVGIDSFLMDKLEVTQAEYEKLGQLEA